MFLIALGLCLLAAKFIGGMLNGLAKIVGHIWIIGPLTATAIHGLEQDVTHAIGGVAEKIQGRIGLLWHATARLVEEVGQKIEDAYRLIGGVAGVLDLFVPYSAVLAMIHALQRAIAAIHGTTKAQTQAVAHAGRIANDARKRVDTAQVRAQAIPADVVVPGDLAGLRGRVREAEDEIAKLWDRVRGITLPSAIGLGVGAVAAILARLGLGWTRCSNVGKVGRNICGMNTDLLDALLAGALVVASPISVVELTKAAQAFTGEAVTGLRWFVRELD